MPSSDAHERFAEAVRTQLGQRSQRWLGERVAELEERAKPYPQGTVSGWLNIYPPNPETVFRIEQALDQTAGTLSRLLGYLPSDALPATSVRDAIASDPLLSETGRGNMLALYESLVRR